jgi:hypothetical protein
VFNVERVRQFIPFNQFVLEVTKRKNCGSTWNGACFCCEYYMPGTYSANTFRLDLVTANSTQDTFISSTWHVKVLTTERLRKRTARFAHYPTLMLAAGSVLLPTCFSPWLISSTAAAVAAPTSFTFPMASPIPMGTSKVSMSVYPAALMF